MAANITDNSQKYEPFAIRIFQGLKPDIVAIQEFNYSNNTPAQIRSFIDTAFGTNFHYFRESGAGYDIPEWRHQPVPHPDQCHVGRSANSQSRLCLGEARFAGDE